MLKRIVEWLRSFWQWLVSSKDEAAAKPDQAPVESVTPPAITPAQLLEIMDSDPPAYRKNEFLCTRSERVFYEVLREAIGYEFLICPKVRLGDILWLPNEKNSKNQKLFINQIQCKHVDFLLCEKWMLKPELVIELDDPGHSRFDRRQQDEFKNKAFEIAGLPLLRVKVQESYEKQELRSQILALIETKN
ncbi:MAG: DUF2726 domain-containing protein [candidate division KSB1 bacterium]